MQPELDPFKLLPFLNRADWAHAPETASRRLTSDSGSLWMTLAWDSPRMIRMAPRSFTPVEWEPVALENLRKRERRPQWMRQEVPGPDGETTILARVGDGLTASDMLDPELMEEACELLGTEVVLVAAPCREAMVVGSDPKVLGALVLTILDDLSVEFTRLGPHLYAFTEGQLHFVGILGIQGEDGAEEEGLGVEEPAGRRNDDSGSSALIIPEGDGTESAVFVLTESNMARLVLGIRRVIQDWVGELMARPSFSGRIMVRATADKNWLGRQERGEVERLIRDWNQSFDHLGFRAKNGAPVRLEIEFEEE